MTDNKITSDEPGMEPEGTWRGNGWATEPTDLSIDAEGHSLKMHPVAEPQEPGMEPQATWKLHPATEPTDLTLDAEGHVLGQDRLPVPAPPATEPQESGTEPDGVVRGNGF